MILKWLTTPSGDTITNAALKANVSVLIWWFYSVFSLIVPLLFTQSFLTDRFFIAGVNNYMSRLLPHNNGVPKKCLCGAGH